MAENKKRSVLVVCGSDSDFEKVAPGFALLRMAEVQGLVEVLPVEVCSAHRNPINLRELLWKIKNERIDVVIMCAGKLAALFGECDALSRNDMQNDHTVFIAVPLKGSSVDSNMAAKLSATQVPNSQFVFKQEFFENPETAFEFAISSELPRIFLEEQKPPQTFLLKTAYEKGRRKYPEKADYSGIIQQLETGGLIHMYTGKTRETFLNPTHPDLLYVLATDRISIFDIVMDALIPGKGADLTMITIFWLTKVFPDVQNHLVAYGAGIVEYLPAKIRSMMNKPGLTYLMKNMIVVKRTQVLKVEAIVRGNLTGSGLKDYRRDKGVVCGMQLPEGLIDGSELSEIMFTPSTKADYGLHDENIPFEEAIKIIGEEEAKFVRDSSIGLFRTAKERLLPLGIIIADTKFEFGKDSQGNIILIDEIMTPDSSRFWPVEGWKLAMEQDQTPPSFDKQPIRIAGEAAGIKTTNPTWVPDQDIIEQTIANYGHIVQLAVGKSREQFWLEDMGISE